MYVSLADSVLSRNKTISPALLSFLLVVGGSALIALCSQVSFPLPFTPVPVTGQTFGVLVVGMALGARKGAMAVLAYLAEGFAGLPVFAGGAAGIAQLLSPTGGYLLGFVLSAMVCGKLAEMGFDRKIGTTLLAMAIGNLVIFLPGLLWLRQFVPAGQAVALGLLPFIPGAIVKTLAASMIFPSIRNKI
jgi:biotin transport system substrate-specific component